MHRYKIVQVASMVILGCVSLCAVSNANPPDIPAGWHKVYQFNLIGHPNKDYTGGCGEGNRIFVNRDANNAQLLVTNGTSWDITDCNATGNHRATLTTNEAAKFAVFVRILGKPDGHVFACADSVQDAGEDLCLLGFIDLTRGKGQSKFSLAPSSMFDASLIDIVWTIDTNSDYRIAQFRVYEIPGNP